MALLLTVYISHVKYLPTALQDKSILTISAAQQFCTYQQRCKTSVYLPTALQDICILTLTLQGKSALRSLLFFSVSFCLSVFVTVCLSVCLFPPVCQCIAYFLYPSKHFQGIPHIFGSCVYLLLNRVYIS